MTISEISRNIGARLHEAFPNSLMYVNDIPKDAEGCFLLVISEIRLDKGITPRKLKSVSFDVVYFHGERDTLLFSDWADTMEKTLDTLSDNTGQLFRTRDKSAVQSDLQYHYMFTVDGNYIELPENGELMENLNATIGG